MSEKICASIDIVPDTLNLKSNGEWVTTYIMSPEIYSVEAINSDTVKLDDISSAWLEIQDGVFMAKFDRAFEQAASTQEQDYEVASKSYYLALTVTGELFDVTRFEGTDTIRVIKK